MSDEREEESMTDEELGEEFAKYKDEAEDWAIVTTAESVEEFFRVLDSINSITTDGWDTAEIDEVVQLILTDRDERPDSILRAREAAGIIEMRVRAHYNVNGPLVVPPEWMHRVPA